MFTYPSLSGKKHKSGFRIHNGQTAHWSFEEGEGSTVGDSSVNGNDGTVVDGMTWETGRVGKYSGGFDGTANNYISVGDVAELDPVGSFTISAWVKPTTLTPPQSIHIMAKGANGPPEAGAAGAGWHLVMSFTGLPQFLCYDGTFGKTYAVASPSTLTAGTWSLVTGVFDSGKSLKIYVDGILMATATTTLTAVISSGIDCRLGAQHRTSVENEWDGGLDDMYMWNRAFSAGEVKCLYDQTA
jgi:hypothetical protein